MPQTELSGSELNNLMTLVSVGKQSFDSLAWQTCAEQLYAKLSRMLHAIDNPAATENTTPQTKTGV